MYQWIDKELALQSSLQNHPREKFKKIDPLLWVVERKLQFEALRAILDKSEESRPPLKLKNNVGLLSSIFL